MRIPSKKSSYMFFVADPKGAAEAFENRPSNGCEDPAFEVNAKSCRSSHGATITTIGMVFFKTWCCCQIMTILYCKHIFFLFAGREWKGRRYSDCVPQLVACSEPSAFDLSDRPHECHSLTLCRRCEEEPLEFMFLIMLLLLQTFLDFSLLRKRRVCLDCAKTRATARGWNVLSVNHCIKKNECAGIKS